MAIAIFTPTANDLSLQYLYTIFGNMNGVIQAAGRSSDDITITLLGTLFKTFNSVLLAVAAFVVVYVTVVGVMMTAHEGQFMGKKWSNMWIPVRTVLGIAALVPTASGYSGVQIIMMWVIVQGIGAADNIWNTTLGYVNLMGSPFAKMEVVLQPAKDGSPSDANPGSIAARQGFKELFKALSCDHSARMTSTVGTPTVQAGVEVPTGNAGYYCAGEKIDGFCGTTLKDRTTPERLRESNSLALGPGGSCGKIKYCDYKKACANRPDVAEDILDGGKAKRSHQLDCSACEAQIGALSTMVAYFADMGDLLTSNDYAYRDYYYSATTKQADEEAPKRPPIVDFYCQSHNCSADGRNLPSPQNADPSAPNSVVTDVYWPYISNQLSGGNETENTDFIDIAVAEYNKQLFDSTVGAGINDTSKLQGEYKLAQDKGWILAGAYYYSVAQKVSREMEANLPSLGYVIPQPPLQSQKSKLYNCGAGARCRVNDAAAKQLVSLASGGDDDSVQSSSSGNDTSGTGAVSKDVVKSVTAAVKVATKSNTVWAENEGVGSDDPIATLIVLGNILLWIVFFAYGAAILGLTLAGIVGNVNAWAVGVAGFNPMGPTVMLVSLVVLPALLLLLGALALLGVTLSIYVPLIPFIIFSFGVIGWFTSVIEAMVAGPIVALGILSPSGRHEVMGMAEPAIGLLFNLFLRPSLMIFGLVAGIMLAGTMLNLINQGMWIVMGQIAPVNPIGLIAFLAVWIAVIVMVLNKCFAAIHIIPENVGRWIGMQGERYGESADFVKSAAGEAAQRTSQAAEATGKGAGQREAQMGQKKGASVGEGDAGGSKKPPEE